MRTSLSDGLAQTERALLGSVLLDNSLWPKAADLSVHDFSHDIHRKIYARMASLFEDQRPVDLITLTSELNSENPAYLSDLLTHALPENFSAYVRCVREAARERQFDRLQQQLIAAKSTDLRLDCTENRLSVLCVFVQKNPLKFPLGFVVCRSISKISRLASYRMIRRAPPALQTTRSHSPSPPERVNEVGNPWLVQ